MSLERDEKAERNARLRARVLGAAGSTALVVAVAVASPTAAEAADRATVAVRTVPRADAISNHDVGDGVVRTGVPAVGQPKQWWRNGWVRPWPNWNNWHNWPNWNNWHNWGQW